MSYPWPLAMATACCIFVGRLCACSFKINVIAQNEIITITSQTEERKPSLLQFRILIETIYFHHFFLHGRSFLQQLQAPKKPSPYKTTFLENDKNAAAAPWGACTASHWDLSCKSYRKISDTPSVRIWKK